MPVVKVPAGEPWVVARWAFARLLDEARLDLVRPDDRHQLDQALALDGLRLDGLEPAQGRRVAQALRAAAGRLERRIGAHPAHEADASFAQALRGLGRLLDRVVEP